MKYLLDTSTFLWVYLGEVEKLPRRVVKILEGEEELFFSVVSGWEIAIKYAIGKLLFKESPSKWLPDALLSMGIQHLPMSLRQALEVSQLKFHHKDPFDRLLAVQARMEGLSILSSDKVFKKYGVDLVWD